MQYEVYTDIYKTLSAYTLDVGSNIVSHILQTAVYGAYRYID